MRGGGMGLGGCWVPPSAWASCGVRSDNVTYSLWDWSSMSVERAGRVGQMSTTRFSRRRKVRREGGLQK